MGALLSILVGGWKFFTGPVGRWVALAAAVLALLAGVHHHGVTQGRDGEKAKADRAINDRVTGWRARLDTCRANADQLDAALTRQNGAVAALAAESAQRSAAAAKALTAAQRATAAANQRVGAILAAKPGADQCTSAEALIMESIR